ncbi:MAG: transglycosylase SLT domain-containing protein [Gammaproteobacteria bacterium]|nr:transglycosylase SLT domain-containing protein [Gammaproteobacteria bacterium]
MVFKAVKQSVLSTLCAATLVCTVTPVAALSDTLPTQRQLFLDAEQALKSGRTTHYRQLEARLRDYPLYPYLEFQTIRRDLEHADYKNIYIFLDKYAGSPLALRLQEEWLKTLARKKQWRLLVDNYYFTTDVALQCDFATALFQIKEPQRAYSVLEGIWQTGKTLPYHCNAPIDRWNADGALSQELVWERIRLSMQAGQVNLGMSLAQYVKSEDRFWVRLWAKVHRDPAYVQEVYARFKQHDSQILRWILGDGVARMGFKEGPAAAALWHDWRNQFQFSAIERDRTERHLALALAREDPFSGYEWLAKFDINTSDLRAKELFILTALTDQDWETALEWMDRLDEAQKHNDRWRYWRGRALEALGRMDEARSIYLLNSDIRSYYGFLAADRAGLGYQLEYRPVPYTAPDLQTLAKLPAIARARELHTIGRTVDARREWAYAIQRMDKAQMLMAAQLAYEWQWHDRAIVTLMQADYWDDLEKRFPLAYRELVMTHAKQQGIEPAWAYAIIRQESAFTEDARSHAGALGLMQLMPTTARQIARSMRLSINRRDLLEAGTNVKLGINYLRKVAERFGGNKVLATAAYNAGDNRVIKWLPKEGTLPADIWVELVPFSETREYCQRVLTYTAIYEQRLGQRPVPLMERMVPIPSDLRTVSLPQDIVIDTGA